MWKAFRDTYDCNQSMQVNYVYAQISQIMQTRNKKFKKKKNSRAGQGSLRKQFQEHDSSSYTNLSLSRMSRR